MEIERPIKEGQTTTVKITAKGAKGDGIAKIRGYTITTKRNHGS